MGRVIRTTMPRVAAATVFGAVVALGACKKNENAGMDTTAMMNPADTTAAAANAAPTTPPAAPMTDAAIVADVATANQGEIAAGKIAESKATNADVKAFARMMVADHSKMLSAGQALAKKANITPDTAAADSLRAANSSTADALNSASKGMTFDTAYVNAQVAGHEATLDMIKSAAGAAQNADLKKMLTDAQPTVQSHLDRIKDIQSKMK